MTFEPSPEVIEQWADAMLEEATDDMSEQHIDITPENLNMFFEEHYDLPLPAEEAKAWLETRDWYQK